MTGHGASGSAVGYLYQIRYALLVLCRDAGGGARAAVSLEVLDDIAFLDSSFTAIELIQTKHHLNSAANLGDASPDLWKTIRVWLDTPAQEGTARLLITTSAVGDHTAASHLGIGGRDISSAVALLDAVAATSTSRANAPAYEMWRKAPYDLKTALLESIQVLGGAPGIEDVRREIETILRYAVPREHVSTFVDYLEGWWFGEVVLQLRGGGTASISASSVQNKIDALRESFGRDSLPVAYEVANQQLTEALEQQFGESVFVSQVHWTGANARRVANAIHDYLRAYAQRSRWVREQLLVDAELRDYDRRLKDAWDVTFLALCDEIGPAATDEAKSASARRVLAWAESISIPLRTGVQERFVSSGSLHMLSDVGEVGWHPEFRSLLAAALGASDEDADRSAG